MSNTPLSDVSGISTSGLLWELRDGHLRLAIADLERALTIMETLRERHDSTNLDVQNTRLVEALRTLANIRLRLPKDIVEDPRTCATVHLSGERADELMAQAEAHDWREGAL